MPASCCSPTGMLETPVVIGRAVGTDEQEITVTTLGELDPEQVDMRCLLIIGSSQTRVVRTAGEARVITPRRYPPLTSR